MIAVATFKYGKISQTKYKYQNSQLRWNFPSAQPSYKSSKTVLAAAPTTS